MILGVLVICEWVWLLLMIRVIVLLVDMGFVDCVLYFIDGWQVLVLVLELGVELVKVVWWVWQEWLVEWFVMLNCSECDILCSVVDLMLVLVDESL